MRKSRKKQVFYLLFLLDKRIKLCYNRFGDVMNNISDIILEHIKTEYEVEPEYLWQTDDTAAIRHNDTKKWFGAYMKGISKRKLGCDSEEKVDILNLKCDPMLNFSVVDYNGIFPGWHMNKEHWISVLLDGTVAAEDIYPLIRMSFALTDKKTKKKKSC